MKELLQNPQEDISDFESGGDIVILWKKYKFSGKPPEDGTLAGNRLKEICARYARMMVFPEKIIRPTPMLANHKKTFGGGEDYFAEQRDRKEMADFFLNKQPLKRIVPSDVPKRELHDQIAIMVVGKSRLGMDETLAEHIADFACELTYNKSLQEMDRLKNQGELI